MHIFIKVGGEIKGRKISYLSMYLLYIVFYHFLKNFLARYARSIAFYFHLEMQACDVLYQPHLYFYVADKATYIRLLRGKIGFLFFSALAP